jgi:integrase
MRAETDSPKRVSVSVERRRSHGAGGIREVRAGVWLVDVELPRDPATGKRRRVSRTIVGTREHVDLELAQLKVNASQRRAPAGPLRSQSVQVALEAYVTDARAGRIELAPKTVVTTTSAIRTMSKQMLSDGRRFGDIRLAALSWQEIEEMYASMKRNGATPAWVRRCATVLSCALTYARKSGVITFNPSMDASRPHLVQEKPYSPTSDEVQELIEEARVRDEEIADAVEIIAGTGLRKGELLGLRVADVNLTAGELHIAWSVSDGGKGVGVVRKPTKRSDWRDVPITDSVKSAIERQLERCRYRADGKLGRDIHLFSLDATGFTPHRPDTFSDRLASARGKSTLTFLDLRHYVATTMFDAGVSYRTVADLLGNSEATLRLHYDGRTDTGKRAAVSVLNRTRET